MATPEPALDATASLLQRLRELLLSSGYRNYRGMADANPLPGHSFRTAEKHD
jgi:hypothetical protein